jgi:nitronate monooxygenase
MWNDRRILDLLGIEHPIILAPMAAATNAEIVAAVSEAGGLGSYGGAGDPPDRLRATVQAIRQRTDRPFSVNLFAAQRAEAFDRDARPGPRLTERLEAYYAELDIGSVPEPGPLFGPAAEQLDVLIEQRVPIISFHFGADASLVARAHEAGAKVLCSATTVAEAKQLEDMGIDAIIAQGSEAGGHRGTFGGDYRQALIGTMALVPQVVDAVSVPVIAAGGIMDARGVAAALALGASAAQMGTAFLGCPEAPIPDAWRASLAAAEAEATTVTEALSGGAGRAIRNRYIEEIEALDEPLLPYPAQYSLSLNLRRAAAKRDIADFIAMWAGQGVGLIRRQPAADLVDDLVAESRKLLTRLAGS